MPLSIHNINHTNNNTLSSSELKPKNELDLTSFKHLAHLCIAILVKLTRNGISIIERNPNKSIDKIATKYPKKLALYSTIEYDTASQNGHFTLVDLK
jgi:hypothetical protein